MTLTLKQGQFRVMMMILRENTTQFQMMIWQHNSLTHHTHAYHCKVAGLYYGIQQLENWDLFTYNNEGQLKIVQNIFFF